MTVNKIGILTAGGLAPCLSSAVGGLIEGYTELEPDIDMISSVTAAVTRACYWEIASG